MQLLQLAAYSEVSLKCHQNKKSTHTASHTPISRLNTLLEIKVRSRSKVKQLHFRIAGRSPLSKQ